MVVLFLCSLRELLKEGQSLKESDSFLGQLVVLFHDLCVLLDRFLFVGDLCCHVGDFFPQNIFVVLELPDLNV
jgi:hypothetical protein